MKILIIGHGYVGEAVNSYLKHHGHITYTVDSHLFCKNDVDLVIDYKHLPSSFFQQFECVFLTAAHPSVKSCENNISALQNNVTNFYNLVAKLPKGIKFIYCSSSSVYGQLNKLDCCETETNYSPGNLYDYSKMAIDTFMLSGGGKDLEWYGLRFGTIAGPAKSCRVEILINAFVNSYKQKGFIEVFNGQIHRPCLGLHHDLNRAIGSIINQGTLDKKGIYNLASVNYTINEYGEQVAAVLKCPINYIKRDGHLYNFTISTKKFEDAFDFQFQESPYGITKKLVDNWDNMVKGNRDKAVIYE